MERVLVTGGAGYIGSILVGDLLQNNYAVTVLDNFSYRQNSLASHYHDSRLNVVVGDVRDEKALSDLSRKHDIILPLAAIVGAPACNQRVFDAQSTNLTSTLSLLRSLSPEQLVVMPTTNSAYGAGAEGQIFTEESALNPISAYARDKVIVEQELLQRSNSVSFRLATVFGFSPRMRLDLLVNNFVYKAIHEGYLVLFEPHFTRNYIHVRDVAEAFLMALRNREEMVQNIFNVGLSDANLTKMQLAEKIKEQIPEVALLVGDHKSDPDQRNYFVSNEKIEQLGFRASHSIESGIAELMRGLRTLPSGDFFNSY